MQEAFRFNNAQARNDYFRKQAGGDAASENKPDELGRLKISYSEGTVPVVAGGKVTQLPVHNIFLYNLQPNDVQEIIRELTAQKKETRTQNAFVPRRNVRDCVQIRVGENDMEQWLQTGMQIVQNILRQSGVYDEQEINDMPGYISNVAVSKAQMRQEYQNAENKAIDVWLAYLKDINNPEIVSKLQAYQRVYRYLDVQYGHVKSAKNVAAILAIDSNATFILTAAEWRDFNRYVKPNAKRFYVLVPLIDNVDKGKLDAVIDKCGWGGTAYCDLPFQVQQLVDMKCQELDIAPPFAHYIEFDISDTEVIPGKEDIFNTQIGLANNLNGELNDKAKEDYAKKHGNEDMPEDQEMMQRTKQAAEFIVNFCQKQRIPFKYNETDSPSTILVNGLVAYYKSVAEADANIDKDTNKEIFAKNATLFTLIITNLALDKISNFGHPVEYTKQEAAEFLKSVTYVLNRLEPALALQPQAVEVNESATPKSTRSKEEILQQFRKFCKQVGIRII